MFIHNEYMHEYIVYGCSWLWSLEVMSQVIKLWNVSLQMTTKKGFKMVNQIDGLDTNLEFCIVLFFFLFLNKINDNAKSDAFCITDNKAP